MTSMPVFIDEYRDLLTLLFLCMLSYLFGFFVIKKIEFYFQRKRFEDDIRKFFDDDFLLRSKIEVTILKLKNELKKISNSELCTNQSTSTNQNNENDL